MYNDFEDDDIVSRYLNQDEKTKTDALFDKINRSSKASAKKSEPSHAVQSSRSAKARTAPLPKAEVSRVEGKHTSSRSSAPAPAAAVQKKAESPAPSAPKKQSFEELKAQEEEKKKKKNSKKRNVWTKVLLSLGCFIIVLVVGFVGIFHYYFGDLRIKKVDEEHLSVNSELESKIADDPVLKKITNIALFGIDRREDDENCRSDAIMIMSINPQKGSIKLISVMRDSYVDIGGWFDKINHAYYYGGPEQAIAALNSNFGLNITDYITVDFSSMANAIDAIGGVYIDVDEDEMVSLNGNVHEVDWEHAPLEQYGSDVWLDGTWTVGYARIRNLDGDQGRTGRQREVVMAAVDEIKKKSVTELPAIAKEVIPMVETSLSYSEIMAFLPMMSKNITLQQTMIPGENDGAYDAIIDEVYYMAYDLDSASQHIYDFIYNDIDPNSPVVTEDSDYDEENYAADDGSYYTE